MAHKENIIKNTFQKQAAFTKTPFKITMVGKDIEFQDRPNNDAELALTTAQSRDIE